MSKSLLPERSALKVNRRVEDITASTVGSSNSHSTTPKPLGAMQAHQMGSVETGEQCLLHLRSKGMGSYNVLVIDQHLGGLLLGSDVAALLRREGFNGCIIMCSANCTAADQDFYFDSGCDFIWPKPYPDAACMKWDIIAQCVSCQRARGSWQIAGHPRRHGPCAGYL